MSTPTLTPVYSYTKSNEAFARAVKVIPGGVNSPVRAFRSVGGTPIYIQKGQGAHLTSVEGDRYIDFCQSFGPLILGHRNPEVQKQFIDQGSLPVKPMGVDAFWRFVREQMPVAAEQVRVSGARAE